MASVKKMKDKGFARAVHREDITDGAAVLGVDLDEHRVRDRGAQAGGARR